jgi:electron transfer flavoprotein beta subunit
LEVVEVDFPFVLSASKGMAEQRIPNMRGIMAARTKPLKVIEPVDQKVLTSVIKFELPNPKTGCKYVDPENMDELVELLHNESKVI